MKQTFVYLLFLSLVSGCAIPSDAWREAARSPLDTGAGVWWEKTKRGF